MRWLRVAYRFPVTGAGVMVGSAYDQACVRHAFQDHGKGFHQRLETLVGAPMADGKDSLLGIAALGEVGRTGDRREGSMRAQQHVLGGILRNQGAAITGKQYRYRVRFE